MDSTHLRRHLVLVSIIMLVSMHATEFLIVAEANVHWAFLLALMAISIMSSLYTGMLVGIAGYLIISWTLDAIGGRLEELEVMGNHGMENSGL